MSTDPNTQHLTDGRKRAIVQDANAHGAGPICVEHRISAKVLGKWRRQFFKLPKGQKRWPPFPDARKTGPRKTPPPSSASPALPAPNGEARSGAAMLVSGLLAYADDTAGVLENMYAGGGYDLAVEEEAALRFAVSLLRRHA